LIDHPWAKIIYLHYAYGGIKVHTHIIKVVMKVFVTLKKGMREEGRGRKKHTIILSVVIASKTAWTQEAMNLLQSDFHLYSVIYQLLDIGSHNQLLIEQTWCVYKQTRSFTQNVPIRKKPANREKL